MLRKSFAKMSIKASIFIFSRWRRPLCALHHAGIYNELFRIAKKQYQKYVKIFFLKSKDEWINLFWSSPPCDYIDLIFGIDLGPTSRLLGFWSPAFNGFYWISANMKRNIFADVDGLFPCKLLGTLQSVFSCCLLTGEEDLINRICLIPHKGSQIYHEGFNQIINHDNP